ncbi:MAG: class I SAM-dependent methyltransferase [Proteobacteria bacterium]|nr:class I SAM-dependent methyltransferase [Pseudomonadota bacterium]
MTHQNLVETKKTYDIISRDYQKAQSLPYQDFLHKPTVLKLVGPVEGKTVLDLGCGDGQYSRLMKKMGASKVVGIDQSFGMLNLAWNAEVQEPLGCEYHCANAAEFESRELYDIVLGNFLLNYASNREQLLAYCKSISGALKPGGRFVGLNFNMALDPTHYLDCLKYGRYQTTKADRQEGDPITVHLQNQDQSYIRFVCYYLSPTTYEAAFKEAGFTNFAEASLFVSEEGLQMSPPGHWGNYLAAPPVVGLYARK